METTVISSLSQPAETEAADNDEDRRTITAITTDQMFNSPTPNPHTPNSTPPSTPSPSILPPGTPRSNSRAPSSTSSTASRPSTSASKKRKNPSGSSGTESLEAQLLDRWDEFSETSKNRKERGANGGFGDEVAASLDSIKDDYCAEIAKRQIRDILFNARFPDRPINTTNSAPMISATNYSNTDAYANSDASSNRMYMSL